MVLKSLSRKSGTHQLLNYLFTNEKKLVGDKQKQILIRHNVRARTLDKWVKEYDKNESYRLRRRKDNVKIYHTVLSFSNKDKDLINEKMLRDTAKQYMKLRGPDNLFIGTAHFDKDHVHLHMVMSGTKYFTGETNRLSRAEFHQLKVDMDIWQQKKYPELINSLPRHGRSKELKQKEAKIDTRSGRVSQRETLLKALKTSYNKSKSIEGFLTHLKAKGHEPYYRAGRLTGVRFEGGLKFRLNRLGYDKEKIDKLDSIRLKEEKTLAELRDLRSGLSRDREQNDPGSRTSDWDSEKENDKEEDKELEGDDVIRNDDIERDDREDNEIDEQETDDSDDIE